MSISGKTFDEIITAAQVQVNSLAQERVHRGTGRHPEDQRVAVEIAQTMYNLGQIKKAYVSALHSAKETIARCESTLAKITSIQDALDDELIIACNEDLKY